MSAIVSTSAAWGRPFVFEDEAVAKVHSPSGDTTETRESLINRISKSTNRNGQSRIPPASVTPASRLEVRPAPQMVSSGVPAIDALTGGLPRGCLTEICGSASSGRTSVLLATVAAATRRGEFCAVIDASDALDPYAAANAGVEFDRLLWVRCGDEIPQKSRTHGRSVRAAFAKEAEDLPDQHLARIAIRENNSRPFEHRLEQVLRATDLLLESGGFGLIVLDLADLPPQSARRIPLTTWFRFRRAVENKTTILLSIEQQPIAGSCSSLLLQLEAAKSGKNAKHCAHLTHAQLLTGINIHAKLIGSRLDRKPARSVMFDTKTAWAG